MTNENTAAQNDTSTETNTGDRPAWPQRFGIMTSLQVKQGRNGRYAIATIDCNKFEQTAFVFNKMALDKLIAAGEGAKVWVKGPIEAVQRDGYSEDVFKVVYAKDITPEAEDGEGTKGEAAAAPADPQDLTAIKGVGAKVAEALTAAGVTTYAGLAAMSDEDLEAAGKGFAARATNGDWRAQAAALAETDGASNKTDSQIDEEIPF